MIEQDRTPPSNPETVWTAPDAVPSTARPETPRLRAEDLSTVRRWAIFAALMVPYVFYSFCWSTEDYLRPFAAESLHLSKVQVSTFYSLQALGALIGSVVLSQWADRYGRRRLYIAITLGFGAAAVGALLVQGYATALMQRFVMGFFLGGVFGCAVSLYVGLFPPTVRGFLSGIVMLVYSAGGTVLASVGRMVGPAEWRLVMVVGGACALVSAAVVWLAVPNDRSFIPWRSQSGGTQARSSKPSVAELFAEGRWRLTLRLALLCGLNFFAYQAFNGWITTYLREVHALSSDSIGRVMTFLYVGSMAGALAWGVVADRFGRRANALGFLLAAASIVVYLRVPPEPAYFAIVGGAYGVGLVASGIWGPYFAELYPTHLRAMAASIFGWGRAVSLFGAVAAGAVAQHFGLQIIMLIGAGVFALAAMIWWTLPETLNKPGRAGARAS